MKRNTSLLFLIRIVKLLVGVLNLSLTAKYFGVSLDKDVWLLALSVVLFLDMAIWGPINETFRSKFIFLRGESGEIEALRKTKSMLFFTVLISIGLVCFIFVYPQFLANIIAPTYSGMHYERLIKMIIIAAPILLITQLSAIATSLLNAYESFFVPEITGFITSIINLVLLVFLAPYIGIYSLVLSYYIGAILLLILLLFQIKKLNILIFSYSVIKVKDFKIFIIFALPFFLPYSFGQISAVLEKTLVSTLGIGYVSVLDYSRKFTDIFTSVLTSVLVTMLVPVLSSKYIDKKPREFTSNFMEILQLGLLLLSFVIPIFTSCSMSIVYIFFNKGKIPSNMLFQISELTIYYSWSILAVFIYVIFGMALLSSNRSKKYAFLGVFAQIISIVINLVFISTVGIYIFPISLFISHIIAGIVMSLYFPYKTKKIIRSFCKYMFILIISTVTIFFVSKYFNGNINPYVQIFNISVLTGVIITIFAYVFNLEEKEIIYKYYSKLKNKCLNS
ncbi:lipid II flippase MurJ [Flavobacterium johnsoniae]|uniref:Uncharacterized protein n=1 Tax=Flavobacterium johnsoniae TaxID=986 RepID=A0A1J7BX32_FLAJO|nr:lipid II flippase MurJ [Flavobacterium johnsoniae]OIV43211.1 hypothetical protein BKM63_03090 [Flavobacterium johnsoniae]